MNAESGRRLHATFLIRNVFIQYIEHHIVNINDKRQIEYVVQHIKEMLRIEGRIEGRYEGRV